MDPKVSVTVVTFNHGEWLAECLDSILGQVTTFPFEVIVGDDASTDGLTRDILTSYAKRFDGIVVPILRDKNVGVTDNYFDVTARCRGEYIAHVDGDDRILAGKLQKQSDFLDAHRECSIVAHDMRVFDGLTNQTIRESFHPEVAPRIADLEYLVRHGCYFGHSTKMYRRSAIISTRRSPMTVDFFLHVEHAHSGAIGYLPEVLTEYRKSSGTFSDLRSDVYGQILQGHLDAYRRALELGCVPEVVFSSRTKFKYNHAMEMLRLGMHERYKELISIDPEEREFATLRHRIAAKMSGFPTTLQWISRLFAGGQRLFRARNQAPTR